MHARTRCSSPYPQSNMLFSLQQALNYTAEAATLQYFPNFRFFMTARANKSTPQWDMTPQPESQCDAAAPSVSHPSASSEVFSSRSSPSAGAMTSSSSRHEWSACSVSGFLNNTDFHDGQGLGHAPSSSAAECCTQCSSAEWSAKGCKFFTFAAGTCWFKVDSNGVRTSVGSISGGVAPLPPPPPPPPLKPCNKWLTAAEASADDSKFLLSFSAVCFLTVRDVAMMHTGQRPMGLVSLLVPRIRCLQRWWRLGIG